MTKDEAITQVKMLNYCTPELYRIIKDREYNGTTRFIWVDNTDIGYRIRLNRARGGSQPNPDSIAQRQPWIELGISESTYFRRERAKNRWKDLFIELNVSDTPANRATFVKLAKAAPLVGLTIREMWIYHLRSLGAVESVPSSSSSCDSGDEGVRIRGVDDSGDASAQPVGCVGVGMCDACHAIHLTPVRR